MLIESALKHSPCSQKGGGRPGEEGGGGSLWHNECTRRGVEAVTPTPTSHIIVELLVQIPVPLFDELAVRVCLEELLIGPTIADALKLIHGHVERA